MKDSKVSPYAVSHFESVNTVGKRRFKRLLASEVAQGGSYGPDATPYDLGDNPLRSQFDYTIENGQRTHLEETFYFDDDGLSTTPDVAKTTTYDWGQDDTVTPALLGGTQQLGKSVSDGTQVVSSQTFSYNLQGRLASVVSTPSSGSATKVDYQYDSSGIRISSKQFTDSNANGQFEAGELDETVEYLVDHRNHTGYAQTIVETTKNSSDVITKRIAYTFGTDEITQTVTDYVAGVAQTPTVHNFGHDAHGSVRVLLDAAGAIAQAYTYAAYGELLAIHNATGASVTDANAPGLSDDALTSLLYSGEAFDSRIGQQYLRARWYDATAGRFSRLDPFFGNSEHPQSFNKYAYTHANPILGIDPTGEFFSIGGILSGFALRSSLSNIHSDASMAALSAAITAAGLHNGGSDFSAEFFPALRDNLHTSAIESLISAVPIVGTTYQLYSVGKLVYDSVSWIYNEDDLDAAVGSGSMTTSGHAPSIHAMSARPPATGGGRGVKQLLLFAVRTDMFASTDDWIQWLTNKARKHHRDGLGAVIPTNHAHDDAAHKLASRLRGQPQTRFEWGDATDEFDTISDRYVAQSKPANFKLNKKFRNQAKRTFEQAVQTGRRPYFHFDGPPERDVLRAIQKYSQRYKVSAIVDTAPL